MWYHCAAQLIENFVIDVLNNGGSPTDRDFAALSLTVEHMYCPAADHEKQTMMSRVVDSLADWASTDEVYDEYLNLMAECDDDFIAHFEEVWKIQCKKVNQ